ncbi:MAG: response regulator [Candidatus Korobacteraceae bacterium]
MKAILFVDDYEVLARVSCGILKMHGYHAEYTYNAHDALAKFEHDKFDLLVSDYHMEGMNGLELAKLVRQKAPTLPIIIVTGVAPMEESNEVDAWIGKQDMFPALLDKIKLLLGEHESQEILTSA